MIFSLESNNINTGFFRVLSSSELGFKVDIKGATTGKILYKINKLEQDADTHFSFSNTDPQDAILTITPVRSLGTSSGLGTVSGMIEMKFESSIDTFNQDIARKSQIEPAIYALEQLLKKVKSVTISSIMAADKLRNLGSENEKLLILVLLFSFLTFIAYAAFNAAQLYYMKAYLNEKKYL